MIKSFIIFPFQNLGSSFKATRKEVLWCQPILSTCRFVNRHVTVSAEAAIHQSSNSSKWQFIKVAIHQSSNSSKQQFIEAANHRSSYSSKRQFIKWLLH
jgi:hypothetical protein